MKHRAGVRARRSGGSAERVFGQCPLVQLPLGSIEQPASTSAECEQRPKGSSEPPASQFTEELGVVAPFGSALAPFLLQAPMKIPQSEPKTPCTSWAAVLAERRTGRLRSSVAEANELTSVIPRMRAITARRNERLDMGKAPFREAAAAAAFRVGPAPLREYGASPGHGKSPLPSIWHASRGENRYGWR